MLNKTQNDSHEKTASARKLVFVSIGLVLCLIFVFYLWQAKQGSGSDKQPVSEMRGCITNPNLETTKISAGGVNIDAEIVKNPEDMKVGLSGRDCLDQDKGMIFINEISDIHCFWMKDMKFPIDMIWLDSDKKVVYIKSNATPESYPDSFCPDKPAQYILEVNNGVSLKNNWQTGTQFSF